MEEIVRQSDYEELIKDRDEWKERAEAAEGKLIEIGDALGIPYVGEVKKPTTWGHKLFESLEKGEVKLVPRNEGVAK